MAATAPPANEIAIIKIKAIFSYPPLTVSFDSTCVMSVAFLIVDCGGKAMKQA